MPGANFCQGCGRPLSAGVEINKPQLDAAPPRQHVCFRCSAPLAADAQVCEKCGLDVANLMNPTQSQLAAGKAADLAEVTFFTQPPPPDPQLAALKTYAGWLAAILFAVIASFAAYSWLEASNVIGRLIGEDAARTQGQALGPLSAVNAQRKTPVPSFVKTDADEDRADAAPAIAGIETAPPVQTAASSEPAEADMALAHARKPKSRTRAKAAASGSSAAVAAAAPASEVLPPLPVVKPEASAAPPPVDSPEQASMPEAAQAQPEAELPPAPAAQAKHKRRVIVTQIEPNRNRKGDAQAASPVEDFFRRWKKSIKQGVTNRPCTQQEQALNQCND